MFMRVGNTFLNLASITRVDVSDDGSAVQLVVRGGSGISLTGEAAQEVIEYLSHECAGKPAKPRKAKK